jgi:hypothetical protein
VKGGAAALALCVCSCTLLIVHSPNEHPDAPPGSILPPPAGECPVIAGAATPVAHVYAFVRADRASASMGASYDALLGEIVGWISARGVTVSHVLVSAYDPASQPAVPLLFHSCAVSPEVTLTRGLPYFAAPGAAAGGCELASVAGRLAALAEVESHVPAALLDGGEPHAPAQFFADPPTYALVVLFDHAARTGAIDACAVGDMPVADVLAALAPVYPNGTLPAERVFYLSIATSEANETTDAFDARCAALDGMPKPLLDVLVPSNVQSFVPLTAALQAKSSARAGFVELCDALSVDGAEPLLDFVRAVHATAGLPTEPIALPTDLPPGSELPIP